MTKRERKIEAAIDAHFHKEGWSLDNRGGDHFAFRQSISIDDEFDDGEEVVVNTTELAKHIAAEC
jgi:hypothetical protein